MKAAQRTFGGPIHITETATPGHGDALGDPLTAARRIDTRPTWQTTRIRATMEDIATER